VQRSGPVASWTELRWAGLRAMKHNFLHPTRIQRVPYVTTKLAEADGPVIASTDYVSDVPDQIRQFLLNPFATLGADDHGFSDTRPAARRYFHIDTHSMVVRALQMLAEDEQIDGEAPGKAAERYRLLDVKSGTTGNAGGESQPQQRLLTWAIGPGRPEGLSANLSCYPT
jgi:pyruvate dehydrogenase E1 component